MCLPHSHHQLVDADLPLHPADDVVDLDRPRGLLIRADDAEEGVPPLARGADPAPEGPLVVDPHAQARGPRPVGQVPGRPVLIRTERQDREVDRRQPERQPPLVVL